MHRTLFGLFAVALLVPVALPATADSCPAKTYVYTHSSLASDTRIPAHSAACLAQSEAETDAPVDTALITPGADVMQIVTARAFNAAAVEAVVTGLGYNGATFAMTAKTCCAWQTASIVIDPADTVLGASVTVVIREVVSGTVVDTVVYHSAA